MPKFTDVDNMILRAMLDGLSADDIAERVGRSPDDIRTNILSIVQRLSGTLTSRNAPREPLRS